MESRLRRTAQPPFHERPGRDVLRQVDDPVAGIHAVQRARGACARRTGVRSPRVRRRGRRGAAARSGGDAAVRDPVRNCSRIGSRVGHLAGRERALGRGRRRTVQTKREPGGKARHYARAGRQLLVVGRRRRAALPQHRRLERRHARAGHVAVEDGQRLAQVAAINLRIAGARQGGQGKQLAPDGSHRRLPREALALLFKDREKSTRGKPGFILPKPVRPRSFNGVVSSGVNRCA